MNITRLDSRESNFYQKLLTLLQFDSASEETLINRVQDIIKAVRQTGDEALLAYTQTFDRRPSMSLEEMQVPLSVAKEALEALPDDQRAALEASAERIKDYHSRQLGASWEYEDPAGVLLGQKVTPLDRVGLYVPGGKAAYPSSVLMNAIPAKVAGVSSLAMVVPMPEGDVNQLVLAAAAVAEVDEIWSVGGAQAVAALAYGTDRIKPVDKIVGPGNAYVANAKKLVFGQVGIDMIAGPSEIAVICDGKTPVDWIVKDLFSQAEHDEDAQAILISPDQAFLEEVQAHMAELLPTLERKDIILPSIENRGGLIQVQSLEEAVEVSNVIAPEHLELSVEDPKLLLPKIRHAGAVFMGRYTAEALGDYCAGPNHVLPTSGTARFSSPLGVYDFQKRTSIIECSARGGDALGRIASVMARAESLEAHALSAECRVKEA